MSDYGFECHVMMQRKELWSGMHHGGEGGHGALQTTNGSPLCVAKNIPDFWPHFTGERRTLMEPPRLVSIPVS